MRWLLHGTITPAAADALSRHGHKANTLADVDLAPEASTADVVRYAQKAQLDVLTADGSLSDTIPLLDKPFGRSIVYLQLAGGDVEQDDAIDRLFARYKRLVPGRLYTVTETRVKVRQLPGQA